VKARFVNGKASALECTYTWKTPGDFERFMRFAERYAESHGLGFSGQGEQNDEETAGDQEA
jgi:photosystem II protein